MPPVSRPRRWVPGSFGFLVEAVVLPAPWLWVSLRVSRLTVSLPRSKGHGTITPWWPPCQGCPLSEDILGSHAVPLRALGPETPRRLASSVAPCGACHSSRARPGTSLVQSSLERSRQINPHASRAAGCAEEALPAPAQEAERPHARQSVCRVSCPRSRYITYCAQVTRVIKSPYAAYSILCTGHRRQVRSPPGARVINVFERHASLSFWSAHIAYCAHGAPDAKRGLGVSRGLPSNPFEP